MWCTWRSEPGGAGSAGCCVASSPKHITALPPGALALHLISPACALPTLYILSPPLLHALTDPPSIFNFAWKREIGMGLRWWRLSRRERAAGQQAQHAHGSAVCLPGEQPCSHVNHCRLPCPFQAARRLTYSASRRALLKPDDGDCPAWLSASAGGARSPSRLCRCHLLSQHNSCRVCARSRVPLTWLSH